MYQSSKVVVTGGTSNYTAGDTNIHNGDYIVNTHASRPGFQLLQRNVAAGALHNSGEVSEQPKCHPGTRVAILEHLLVWARALTYTYPIIWIHGPAGAGKSAILRTIAQILADQKLLLASFFFFRSSPGRNNSDKFIATIAYQLTYRIPSCRPHIEDAIERDPLIFSLSLWDQAQALIVSPILAVRHELSSDQSSRVIVVDGLDECREPEKQCEILQVLCRVTRELQAIPFVVLVASRPEHHIRNTFDFGELNKLSSRLSLDNSYEPDADIEKYLKDKFNMIQANHPQRSYLPSPWPTQEVIDKLVAKASGQFIYASTVDKFVSSTRHNPAKRLDIILGTIDAGALKPFEQLDILYSTIFLTINPENLTLTLRVLGVLLVPLQESTTTFLLLRSIRSPQLLEGLLELEPGDVRSLLFDLESLLTVGRDDEEVRFYHASLSDYLFDRSRSGQFWIDAGLVYTDLANQGLHVLFKSKLETVVRDFCFQNSELFFLKATPTPCLDKAIKKHHRAYAELTGYSKKKGPKLDHHPPDLGIGCSTMKRFDHRSADVGLIEYSTSKSLDHHSTDVGLVECSNGESLNHQSAEIGLMVYSERKESNLSVRKRVWNSFRSFIGRQPGKSTKV